MSQQEYQYTVILEPQPEGGYTVIVPALPGCVTEGDTREEALMRATEAITGYIECLVEDGNPIPVDLPAQPLITSIKVVA